MAWTKEYTQQYMRLWRANNRDKTRSYSERHYYNNLEVARAYKRGQYVKHRNKRLAQQRVKRATPQERVRRRAESRQYYLRHKEAILIKGKTRRQTHKQLLNAYQRQYRRTHPEYRTQRHLVHQRWLMQHPGYSVQWRRKNRHLCRVYKRNRRARKAGVENTLTQGQWEAIKAAYKQCCAYCGKKPRRLEQDHIIAMVRGGVHTMGNIVPACRSCNARKWANMPSHPIQMVLL